MLRFLSLLQRLCCTMYYMGVVQFSLIINEICMKMEMYGRGNENGFKNTCTTALLITQINGPARHKYSVFFVIFPATNIYATHLKSSCIDLPNVSKLTKSSIAPWCLT